MKTIRFIGVVLCCYCFFFAGCFARTSGIEGVSANDSKVVFSSTSLKKGLSVNNLSSFMIGDLLKAQVQLASKVNSTQKLQYQFSWYNESGMEINTGNNPWVPVLLYGKESKTIQAVAPNSSVKTYKINIRETE